MSAGIDATVLVRVLLQDPAASAQCAAAKQALAEASASGEPVRPRKARAHGALVRQPAYFWLFANSADCSLTTFSTSSV
jgi:hypothetical protein